MSASRMFPVTDFFEIKKGKRLTKANMVPGDIPFVGSSATNNGITAYIGNDTHLHEPGTITVSYNGSVGEVFLQDERFWASDDVNVWYPKQKMTIEVKLYFMAAIKKLSAKYSYTNKWTIDKMRSELVELPVDSDGKPNFNCMQERIVELEQERIAELEQERIAERDAYLVASGLDDYELTVEDKQILSLSPESASDEADASEADFGNGQVRFKKFKIIDVFDVRNTKCVARNQISPGSGVVPYLTAGNTDNAVGAYISCRKEWLDDGNCVFIGGKTMVVTYQEHDFVSNDSHNLALYLKDKSHRTSRVQQYLVTIVNKALSHKYYWGDSISKNKIQNDVFYLPVTSNGHIDFDYMERYIRAIEKLTIADVVKYKDGLIDATKKVVGICA